MEEQTSSVVFWGKIKRFSRSPHDPHPQRWCWTGRVGLLWSATAAQTNHIELESEPGFSSNGLNTVLMKASSKATSSVLHDLRPVHTKTNENKGRKSYKTDYKSNHTECLSCSENVGIPEWKWGSSLSTPSRVFSYLSLSAFFNLHRLFLPGRPWFMLGSEEYGSIVAIFYMQDPFFWHQTVSFHNQVALSVLFIFRSHCHLAAKGWPGQFEFKQDCNLQTCKALVAHPVTDKLLKYLIINLYNLSAGD